MIGLQNNLVLGCLVTQLSFVTIRFSRRDDARIVAGATPLWLT